MKEQLQCMLALVFVLLLCTSQLPGEYLPLTLRKALFPFQRLSFTDTQYRMFAPGPITERDVPQFLIEYAGYQKRLLPYQKLPGYPNLTPLNREKLLNFTLGLTALASRYWQIDSLAETQKRTKRMLLRICKSPEVPKRVEFVSQKIDFKNPRKPFLRFPLKSIAALKCGNEEFSWNLTS